VGQEEQAMSQENVEMVREGFAHFLATGEPAWETLHEQIEVHDHDILDAGEYRGHAGYRRWLQDWGASWSEFSLQLDQFIDAADRVIAVYRLKATGRVSGVTLERQDAMVCQVLDGRVVRIDYFNNLEQALEAVGLEG
jgi:ketosteroid isomerase-like protein